METHLVINKKNLYKKTESIESHIYIKFFIIYIINRTFAMAVLSF